MAGYIRQDVTNNIADGNVINASDFDNEYNTIEAAFHATTGHTHDGTSAEGAPITKIGPAQDIVAGVSSLTPKTDNTVDLGSSTLEFKDLYIDGTANIDSLVADTADINAGTIDGVTIGGASAGAGSFTTLSASSTTTLSGLTASTALALNASKEVVSVTNTGTGNNVMSASPTLTGTVAGASLQLSSLTSGRVTYAGASGLLQDSTNLTFDGTSLTLGGNPTLSAGTANGVLYLNGSKVATSGSALTFDGTNFTTTGYAAGNGLRSLGGNAVRFYNAANANWSQISAPAGTGDMQFDTGAGEQMRLTSTGLGIGTSSPGYSLDIIKDANSFVGERIRNNDAGSSAYAGLILNASGNSWGIRMGSSAANSNALQFAVDALGTPSTLMTLNPSGNLGLGVTPSAWNSSCKTMQIGPRLGIYDTGTTGAFVYNAYINTSGNFIYSQTAAAALYDTSAGQHRWYTAPSGTAGDPISFGDAKLTLDASGRLLVGVTSASGNAGLQLKGSTSGYVRVEGTSSTLFAGDAPQLITGAAATESAIRADGALLFASGGGTERARITSGGNLLVGTTSDYSGLTRLIVESGEVRNTYFRSSRASGSYLEFGLGASGATIGSVGAAGQIITSGATADLALRAESNLVFSAGGTTERARITSGGDLLVGTTDAAQTSGAGFKVGGAGGIGVGQVAIVDPDSTNTTVTYRLYSTGAAAYRFYVGLGGTIYATSATITSLSDQRLKENIQNIDVGLDAVMALKPRKFDWKAGKGKDKKNDRGFIAQEFEQVFPEMIDTWRDPAPEGEEPYKAVNADLIPVLVKAIQEQQALITALTARVAALESN